MADIYNLIVSFIVKYSHDKGISHSLILAFHYSVSADMATQHRSLRTAGADTHYTTHHTQQAEIIQVA